jgi:pyruvate/2-oxoacid:ferredoxin oxidoreductase alpha subunit
LAWPFSKALAIALAQATADYLREKRNIKVGVVNMTFFRPFPGDLISAVTILTNTLVASAGEFIPFIQAFISEFLYMVKEVGALSGN